MALLWTRGIQLWDDVYWSTIFMSKFWSHCLKTQIFDPNLAFNNKKWYWEYFLTNVSTTLILLIGLVGWFVLGFKKRGIELSVGAAVIAGAVVSWATSPFAFRQNFVPGLLCMMFVTPYMSFLLKKPGRELIAVLLLLGLSLHVIVVNGRDAMGELNAKVAANDFANRPKFLDLIPAPSGSLESTCRIPAFAEDRTFVTYDEWFGNPPDFTPVMPKNSEALSFFQPESFAKSLSQSPPASIAFDRFNYPPGWNQVLQEFLRQHRDNYRPVTFPNGQLLFIREDLLRHK